MAPSTCRNPSRAKPDITVPIGLDEARARESLRWPPVLDHAEIVRRLVEIRDFGPLDTGDFFAGVEAMSPARIGAAVIGALAWLQDHHTDNPLSHQLQILALNLKNL